MSTDTFIALLLVSTFATVGIVATLAVRSRRHWFIRTAVVVAMLSPLLAIPAPELFVTLLLEAATIAAGLGVIELIRTRAANVRFSLLSLVLSTTLVGALLAVGRALPALNRYAWQSLVLMGVGSGLCVLLGLAAVARWPRWYLRLLPIVLASLLIGLVLAWFDWLVLSLRGYNWPPTNSDSILRVSSKARPIDVWLAICPAITAVVALWFAAQRMTRVAVRPVDPAAVGKTHSRGAGAVFVSLTISIALLPTVVLFRLLTPGPDPRQRLPSPNAYDTIVEVANEMIPGLGFFGYDSDSEAALARRVIRIERRLDTVQAALDGESLVRLEISPSDNNAIHDYAMYRGVPNLAYALLARGKLDRSEGRHQEAFQSYLDAIRLGYAVRSGGTLFHASIGRDASKAGAHQLYRYRHTLSADQCHDAIAVLLDWESNIESVDQVNARGRAWVRIALGWHGHLRQLAADVSGMSRRLVKSARNSFLLNRAFMRLLIVELALEAYRLEHGDVPASLSGLVPEYLPDVPLDPCDDAGGELRYTPTEDGYVLYSLGGNRRDDGGAPPVDGSTVKGSKGTGDLQLRVIFGEVADQAGVQFNSSPPASMFRRHR